MLGRLQDSCLVRVKICWVLLIMFSESLILLFSLSPSAILLLPGLLAEALVLSVLLSKFSVFLSVLFK
jgi:membrane protein DedA with SNARE-associated domain